MRGCSAEQRSTVSGPAWGRAGAAPNALARPSELATVDAYEQSADGFAAIRAEDRDETSVNVFARAV
jgi:hypothetical protein